jgi:O-antigen/teichoic acid export membrane protein
MFNGITSRLKRWQHSMPYLWSMADQGVASLGNILLLTQLSRGMASASFGEVSFAYSGALLAMSVVRAMTSDVILSSDGAKDGGIIRDRVLRRPILVVALLLSVVGGAVASVRSTPELGLVVIALGVLLIQDRLRLEWTCRKQMARTFSMDFAWLLLQVALLVPFRGGVVSPTPLVALSAWILGALGSTALGLRHRSPREAGSIRGWVRENRSRSVPAGTQTIVVNASTLAPTVIFSAMGRPAWIGAFVVANSITGIQPLVANALRPILYRRFAEHRSSRQARELFTTCAVATAVSAVAGLASIVLMSTFGHALYGNAAALGLPITYWLVLKQLIGTSSTLLIGVTRSRGRWGASLTGEILTTVASVSLMTGAAIFGGVAWVTPFQVVGSAVSLGIWLRILRRTSADEREAA